MNEPVEVHVTEEDIRNGKRYKPYNCPVALAMTRVLGKRVAVGPATFRFPLDDDYIVYRTPHEACMFILYYDSGRPAAPFSFTVDWTLCPDIPSR